MSRPQYPTALGEPGGRGAGPDPDNPTPTPNSSRTSANSYCRSPNRSSIPGCQTPCLGADYDARYGVCAAFPGVGASV